MGERIYTGECWGSEVADLKFGHYKPKSGAPARQTAASGRYKDKAKGKPRLLAGIGSDTAGGW